MRNKSRLTREAMGKLICGCSGYLRWQIGLASWQDGMNRPGAGPVDLIGTAFARPPGVPVRQPDVQSPAQLQSQPRSGPTLSQPGLFKPDSPLWNSYI